MSGKRWRSGRGSEASWGRLSSRLPASGQNGVWVVGREGLGGIGVDEALL